MNLMLQNIDIEVSELVVKKEIGQIHMNLSAGDETTL